MVRIEEIEKGELYPQKENHKKIESKPKKSLIGIIKESFGKIIEYKDRYFKSKKFIKEFDIYPEEKELDERFDNLNLSKYFRGFLKITSPKFLNNYDDRFTGYETINFLVNHYCPSEVNEFPKAYSGAEIIELKKDSINLESIIDLPIVYDTKILKDYFSKEDDGILFSLKKVFIYPDFYEEFKSFGLTYLVIDNENNVFYNTVFLPYSKNYNLGTMHHSKIDPKLNHRWTKMPSIREADSYESHVLKFSKEISLMLPIILSSVIEKNKKSKVRQYVGIKENFKYLSLGGKGIVLFNEDKKTVYKFSNYLKREMDISESIKGSKHIINYKNTIDKKSQLNVMELEYINGNSLEELCDYQKKTFDTKETMKYASEVFDGLRELKELEISHNDLWLGNIMLDYDKKRAVIIDLGLATNSNELKKEGSRRYGGSNDLNSLGQIIYKMITGRHLFNPTVDKSTYMIADEIKEERLNFYSDNNTLEKRLKQVDENIEDKDVTKIIKICLTAKNEENYCFPSEKIYQELKRRFKDYS